MPVLLNFMFAYVTIYPALLFSYTFQSEYGDITSDNRDERIYGKMRKL